MTFTFDIDADTGRVETYTDPNGNDTSYDYDDIGRLIVLTPPLDTSTAYVYDSAGRYVTVTQGGLQIRYGYDGQGRMIQTRKPGDGASYIYVYQGYDAAGNPAFVSEATEADLASAARTTTEYGAIGRIVRVTDPDDFTEFAYDGNLVTMTRETQETQKIHDAFGRLTQVTDAMNQVFNYTYDVMGNLTTVDHPGTNPGNRTFAYNGLGWLMNESHPETGVVSYTYFDTGKVETVTKASGKMTEFEYDSLNRMISQISGTGSDRIEVEFYYDGMAVPGHSYTYDNAINHRTGAIVRRGNPGVEESCLVWSEYDDQGRNLRKDSILASPSITNVMGFGYDSMGNLESIAYPDGRVTANYTYGPSTNLLNGVSVTGSVGTISLATALSHNPAGGLQNVTYGNGIETEILPDLRNRPDTWQTVIGAVDLINHDFTYDDFGNITDISAEYFVYDNLNRLTNATGISGRNFSYGFDANGNVLLVAKTSPSESSSFTYSNNRLNGVTYDADGNLTNDGVYTYDYDQFGQMTSSGTDSYAYDALGKRILKTSGTDSMAYCYLGEQLIATYGENLLSYYDEIYLEGQLLARVVDDGVSITDVTYAHLNHLGSPVAFTDDSGNVVWPGQTGGTPYEVHSYEPFGADFADLGSPIIEQDVRFTGKLFDASTEKHYFNARYYNGITTDSSYEMPPRFLSPDVINGNPESGQSWNRYGYCLNNPVNMVDPDGNYEVPVIWHPWDKFSDLPYDIFGIRSMIDISTSINGASAKAAVPSKTGSFSAKTSKGSAIEPVFIKGIAAKSTEARFVVTESGVAIPSHFAELKANTQLLKETSTAPATARKFAGTDSQGPLRVRVEKAYPSDPNFTNTPDPLHTVDHLHIDRRSNVTFGPWGSTEKVPYEWPF